jgi:hypothetical protein
MRWSNGLSTNASPLLSLTQLPDFAAGGLKRSKHFAVRILLEVFDVLRDWLPVGIAPRAARTGLQAAGSVGATSARPERSNRGLTDGGRHGSAWGKPLISVYGT